MGDQESDGNRAGKSPTMLSKIIVGTFGIFATVAMLLAGVRAYVDREIEFHKLAVGHGGNRTRMEIHLIRCETDESRNSDRCEAMCPIGKSVIAGGCEATAGSGTYSQVFNSAPNAQRNGWICDVSGNPDENTLPLEAKGYAICADFDLIEQDSSP